MPVKALGICSAFAVGLGLLLAAPAPSAAQTWPSKPIRFIVPFPAGGSSDTVARSLQPALEKILGQSVVVENRAGAGGVLGVEAIARAAPDGYTIGIAGAGALGVNVGEPMKRPYDPLKDLALISRAAASPFMLVAHPSLKADTVTDVIKLAKAQPHKLSIGYGGNGTAMHLAALTLLSMADVKINIVPYRGTAPAVGDAIAGHVQLAIADPPPSMGAIADGRLKLVGVTSKGRYEVFPNAPSFDEMGLKGYDVTGWFGIAAPAATPREIVAKLNAAIVAGLNDSGVAGRIRTVGMIPTPTTPEQFLAFVRSEIEKAAKIAASVGEKAK